MSNSAIAVKITKSSYTKTGIMTTELPGDLFQCIRAGQIPDELNEQFPIYPLNAPGIPVPGDNFIAEARRMGDPAPEFSGKLKTERRLEAWGCNIDYLYRRALYDENFQLGVEARNGIVKQMPLVPGHLLSCETENMQGGPLPARIMLLGKNPGKEEVEAKRNFVGPTSQILFDAMDELGVGTDRGDYYVDNLVKWPTVDEQSSTLPKKHIDDCAVLLQQTLRLVRPEFLLCLGSDASKALLGNQFGVQAMTGRVEHLTIPIHYPGEEPQYHTIKVMAALHPAAVFRTPERYPELKDQIAQFISLTNGADIGRREAFIDHRNVYKHRELKKIVDEIIADPDPWRRVIAVDGEWEGEFPTNDGAYLRTVQFSSKHGEGICVVLRNQGGEPAFKPSIGHAVRELNRLLKTDTVNNYFPRPGGHFLRADLPWLVHEGIDIRDEYAPAIEPGLCRTAGGWDTGLMYHAVNETASYRLTDMTVRLTSAPVYDITLKQHITDYCKDNEIKKEDLEGFGFLPKWILHPEPYDPEYGHNYAQYDPDVTRRIAVRHLQDGGLLDNDWHGNPSWEPYWRSHNASLGVLEMEMNGIMVDKDRVDELTNTFMAVKNDLLHTFRNSINWPEFNPESPAQCVAFLFGDRYSTKRDKKTGDYVAVRPERAMSLNLTPVKSTGRRPRLWSDIVSRGEERSYTPSTDKEVLGILGHHHELAMQLRDLKFITQVLKGPLRPPLLRADGMGPQLDSRGHCIYMRGLAACAQADGRVHTHISQVKETGRGASARPPLQNLSKRREGDYSRIMGTQDNYDDMLVKYQRDASSPPPRYGDYDHIFECPMYKAPIRTLFCASPGHVLVEADYTGAELAVIAWLSGDRTMIEHVRLNALPEDHPDHYDIHSQRAVSAFQLDCEPTKAGLKKAGQKSLRVAAKNVNFGIPYGRSAEAIARQCKEEGTTVAIDDCQRMIDSYFMEYPMVAEFLAECRRRSQDERWLCGSFGRYRRFISTRDRGVIGEQHRQAQNFPIQNTVADAVWMAVSNFHTFRRRNPDHHFKLLLQIHDALLFEVPIPRLQSFIDDVLYPCMVHDVPIWPRRLDNTPMSVSAPYHFGIDKEVQLNWGEDITREKAEALGIPLDLI